MNVYYKIMFCKFKSLNNGFEQSIKQVLKAFFFFILKND
jgi:hypothetical protein